MNSNYDDKRIYKVKLDYDYFKTNNLGSKIRDTLEEIEKNQSFLIVYTLNTEINDLGEPLGYYLYNTRIIITPLAIKRKKEITKSLVELIRNSKFDEDNNDNNDNNDTELDLDNNGITIVEEDIKETSSINR